MLDTILITDALVNTFRAIPELVAEHSDASMIWGYVDMNPDRNSIAAAKYTMAPGSIMVAWDDTKLNEENADMGWWLHRFRAIIKAAKGKSSQAIKHKLVNGVPDPGDGQRWHYCPIIDGSLPPKLETVQREPDDEGIDFLEVHILIRETGDA